MIVFKAVIVELLSELSIRLVRFLSGSEVAQEYNAVTSEDEINSFEKLWKL
jgi:hypothetical protein